MMKKNKKGERKTLENDWNKYLENKTVLVVGYGITGIKSSEFAKRLGAKVYVYDDRGADTDKKVVSKMFSNIETVPWEEISLVVTSPGVALESEILKRALKEGKQLIGEIEFAHRYASGRCVAITGTNGKTTTTTILGEILKRYSQNTYVTGNIRISICRYCR